MTDHSIQASAPTRPITRATNNSFAPDPTVIAPLADCVALALADALPLAPLVAVAVNDAAVVVTEPVANGKLIVTELVC